MVSADEPTEYERGGLDLQIHMSYCLLGAGGTGGGQASCSSADLRRMPIGTSITYSKAQARRHFATDCHLKDMS